MQSRAELVIGFLIQPQELLAEGHGYPNHAKWHVRQFRAKCKQSDVVEEQLCGDLSDSHSTYIESRIGAHSWF